jgi:hypothetical protein
VIRAGGISLNLRTLQENIDARRNGTLSWSHLIQSIEKTAHVAGQPMRKGELFRLLRPELEARLGHKLTNLEQAKLGSNAPLMGFAATVCEHFKLDTKAPQLGRILMETETRSLEKGATMAAGTPLHILATAPSADTCEALRITDEESAAKAWEKLIMREVIVRARAMNPEHYTDHLSNAQVWAMLVNTVCNLQHDKDSPFAVLILLALRGSFKESRTYTVRLVVGECYSTRRFRYCSNDRTHFLPPYGVTQALCYFVISLFCWLCGCKF